MCIRDRVYLEDQAFEIPGLPGRPLKVWGSPYQPEFCDWAFNMAPDETRAKAQLIPSDTDVLITHGPPLGHGDMTSRDCRVGDADLLHEIQARVQPIVHCFGHIHSGYGVSSDGTTVFANASTCTSWYHPSNPPIVFDLGLRAEGETDLAEPVFQRCDVGADERSESEKMGTKWGY
eukprot:TRINITY_DN4975_c0_g1_i4.p1 TRINITY_DN4975_c0_g1~~TRINITY_DN4975_c0_g1_i4.p1  ORF type:complete len:176 (+),score=27.95 TRINITY_DN4975_c0_g1_i4:62-589(+)